MGFDKHRRYVANFYIRSKTKETMTFAMVVYSTDIHYPIYFTFMH